MNEKQLIVLGANINVAHDRVVKAGEDMIEKARRVGEMLVRAKASVPHGDWQEWQQQNLSFSARTARKYMQISENWESLGPCESLDGALGQLAIPKRPSPAILPEKNSEKNDASSAGTDGSSPAAAGTPPGVEEWDEIEDGDEVAEDTDDMEDGTEAGMDAWREMADKHREWANTLNRIRREIEQCDREHAYLRHCALRLIQDLKQMVATVNQNAPVDETWKTKGEVERRRR